MIKTRESTDEIYRLTEINSGDKGQWLPSRRQYWCNCSGPLQCRLMFAGRMYMLAAAQMKRKFILGTSFNRAGIIRLKQHLINSVIIKFPMS